jgi:hypothetical protein
VNTDAPTESALYWAERRVLEIQTKLHKWAPYHLDLWRARCRANWHAGFGRRLGETHQR